MANLVQGRGIRIAWLIMKLNLLTFDLQESTTMPKVKDRKMLFLNKKKKISKTKNHEINVCIFGTWRNKCQFTGLKSFNNVSAFNKI